MTSTVLRSLTKNSKTNSLFVRSYHVILKKLTENRRINNDISPLRKQNLLIAKVLPQEKVTIKGKCYQNASILIEYGDCTIEEHTYTGVRVTLKDRLGRRIFKEPMLLLTNRQLKKAEQAYGIYFIYLA